MKIIIIQNIINLFRIYGIKSLSMGDISRLSGISAKILHQYFSNKKILIKECIKYRISQEEIFKYADDNILDFLMNYSEAYPKLSQKIDNRCQMEIKKYYPDTYHFLVEYCNNYLAVWEKKTGEGIVNGYIKKDISPHLVYHFLKKHFFKLIFGGEHLRNIDALFVPDMILAFTREITTVKGQKYIDKKIRNNETC